MNGRLAQPGRNVVSAAMRDRLMSNREGRLHRSQWMSVVTEPIIVLLMLAAPILIVLGPRFKYLLALNIWLLLILLVLLIGYPAYRRARRYMAAPMAFAVVRSPDKLPSPLQFWRQDEFVAQDGKPIRFKDRLAPGLELVPGQSYLVYYLVERRKNVLLSLAPADHPRAGDWYPSRNFDRR